MSTQSLSASAATVPVIAEHIAITPGVCGGKPCIAGHRIKVAEVVIWHERMGQTPAQIVAQNPGVTLGDVHAALAYYHDHREEIDADIRAEEKAFEALQAQQPSLLEKIAARRPDVMGLSNTAALAYLRSGFCPPDDVERLRTDLPRRLAASSDDPDLVELQAELAGQGPRRPNSSNISDPTGRKSASRP
jgi:uncharacterized protein (DUF433 family)